MAQRNVVASPLEPAGSAPPSPTASSQSRRVIAVGARPTRASLSLSPQEDLLLHRTSLVLSSSTGVMETVLAHSELGRLRQFGSKYFGRHRHESRKAGADTGGMLSDQPPAAPPASTDRVQSSSSPAWRGSLRRVVKSNWFRLALYTVVVVDMVVLAMDNEYYAGSALAGIDVACTLLLLLEVVLKCAAFGTVGSRTSYFGRSRFRTVNVALLLAGLLSHLGGAKWKVVRGLKTARSLTLYAGLRRILKALARAVPFLANVGTLSLFGLLAFSIFGLEAYNGSYDSQCAAELPADTVLAAIPRIYCSANSSCEAATQFCDAAGAPSKHINFDSGLSSLFLVFLVVAQDGWVADIMEPVMEATSALSAVFFVAIVASMVFLVVNLFVAVITTAFMNFTVDESDIADGQVRCMGKMDPDVEETHVNMIMGATLVLEESILASERKASTDAQTLGTTTPTLNAVPESTADGAAPTPIEPTTIAHDHQTTMVRPKSAPVIKPKRNDRLVRTRNWRSLRNLTVERTIRLIQNGVPVEELAETLARAAPIEKSSDGEEPTVPDPLALPLPKLIERLSTGRYEASLTRRSSARHMTKLSAFLESSATPDGLSASTHALVMATRTPEIASSWFGRFQRLVLSRRFDDVVTVCIMANTVSLLIEYEGMSQSLSNALSVTEYLFGGIFLFEMVLRIVALRGLRGYLSSTERVFDMIVVICTSINMVLNNVNTSGYSGLNSASSLRTLRVSRLMMKYEGTRKLLESIVKSSRGVVDVVVFMLLFQVVNSIIGMQLFGGGHLHGEDETPRWNFDTFGRSFLTLLQVITGDQWSSIAYDAVDASNPHWFMVPFLVINFVVGQYVLLNLFIAVILENFSISEEEAYQLQLAQIIAVPKELDIYEKIEEVGVRAFGEMEQLDNVSNVKLRMFLGIDDQQQSHSGDLNSFAGASNGHHRHGRAMQRLAPPGWLAEYKDKWVALCHRVAHNAWFSRLMQVVIIASCVCLILDDPHPHMSSNPPSASFTAGLKTVNRVVLVLLVLEFIIKVSAAGFGFNYLYVTIFHSDERLGFVPRQAYMEDKWNQLDFVLLLLTITDELITLVNPTMSAARVVRAVRVLRPLRMLNKNAEMKAILSAVAQSLPQVGNVLAVCLMVYIIFSVVGRSLFSGKFYSCNDDSVSMQSECVGFFVITPDGALPLQEAKARGIPGGDILVPRVWANARFSFDNIGSGFITLLEMTSLKWIDKAFAAMDIVGKGKQPELDHATEYAAFFIMYVYIGALFVIRLFVGVLVEQFQRNNGTEILTESQKSWVDLEKFILLLKPLQRIPRPKPRWQNRVYDLCQHPYFTVGVSVAVLLNIALLLVSPTSSKNGGDSSVSFTVIEIIFLAIFSLEAALKTIGLRQYYLLRPNGAFEVLILSGSLVAYFFATGYHSIIQAGRIFRMMRVLRFVNLNRGVYTVFQTFRASLRPIGQIFFLMSLIFFIFAVIARQLFGGVKLGPALNHFSNFRTFGSSILLLFQIMSGDDWHLTMTDCMARKPFCAEFVDADTGGTYSDCGTSAGAAFFFVTYVTMVVFVFLNLFIAVILENFRSCYLKDDVCAISLRDFETYREVFLRYDTKSEGSFPLWQLASFLAEMPPSLRLIAHRQRAGFLQIRAQAQAQIEIKDETRRRPYFNELLRILCIHQMGIRSLPYEQQRDRVKQIFIYRSKVAQMLVDSVVRGYIQRFRLRRARRMALAAQEALRRHQKETQTETAVGGDGMDACTQTTPRWSEPVSSPTVESPVPTEEPPAPPEEPPTQEQTEKQSDRSRRKSNHRKKHRDQCRHSGKQRRQMVLPDLVEPAGDAEPSIHHDGAAKHRDEAVVADNAPRQDEGDSDVGLEPTADRGTDQQAAKEWANVEARLAPKRTAEPSSGNLLVRLVALPPSSKVLPSL